MNHITRQFIEKYDREHPGFASRYCQVADLYDADLDTFHIEEVQDEYEEFKKGEIVSNFIVNAFMLPNACIDGGTLAEFKGAPLSVYVYLVRRTRGWGVDTRAISIAEFERSTGYKKDAVIAALRLLEDKGIIEATRKYKSVTEYKLCDGVLDSEKPHQESEVGKNDKKNSNLVGKTESNLVGKTASIKTTSFKASLKQGVYSEDFEKFWESYPRCKRKSDKSGTFKTFEKYKSVVTTETLIKILNAQKQDQSWIKQDGEFIPAPTAWLNQKNWENDYWTTQAPVFGQAAPIPQNLKTVKGAW